MKETIKFNTANELVDYCINNNILVGQVWVDSNPWGEGGRKLLWFYIACNGNLNTYIFKQLNIIHTNYAYCRDWYSAYEGSFELVLPYNQVKEVTQAQIGEKNLSKEEIKEKILKTIEELLN
jgi:hypothetical protein